MYRYPSMFQSNLFASFLRDSRSHSDNAEAPSNLGCDDMRIGKDLPPFPKDYHTQKHPKTQNSISEELNLRLCSNLSYVLIRLSFSSSFYNQLSFVIYIPILTCNFRLCWYLFPPWLLFSYNHSFSFPLFHPHFYTSTLSFCSFVTKLYLTCTAHSIGYEQGLVASFVTIGRHVVLGTFAKLRRVPITFAIPVRHSAPTYQLGFLCKNFHGNWYWGLLRKSY